MSEGSDPGRKSKVSRAEVLQILQKIGTPNLPKGFTQRKTKIPQKREKQLHYLTSGQLLNENAAFRIEEEYRNAYKLPVLPSYKIATTQRKKGAFRSLHTYRSRLEACKQERLYVPQDFTLPGKSITEDIDPEYFSIITGSAVKDRGSLREHAWVVRTCFRTQLKSGRLIDEVLKLDRTKQEELKILEKAEKALQKQVEGFEKFLQEDHAVSAKWMAEAERAVTDSQEKEERLKILQKELDTIKTRVVLLEEQWRHSKLLQKFLYNVAPLPWRRLHDIMHKRSGGDSDQGDGTVFGRLRGASLTAKMDITSKIARIALDAADNIPPALYFEDPDQLQEMFKDLEERNIGALLQCEKLKPAVRTMNKALTISTEEFEIERATLEQDVADLQNLVAQEEAKAKALEKEAKQVSEEHLHNLLTERRAVSITACVEDAFERVVGPNDRDLDALAMLRAIEETFLKLQLELDIMPREVVQRVSASWKKEEKRVMLEAQVAAKKVHQMDRLTKKFTNALKPWTPHPKRRLMKRSEPPKEKLVKESPPPPLTVAQREQRHFFELTETADMYRPMA